MAHPFSITVFATTGDPEGIRYVDKSNWSGCGVVFRKEQLGQLKHERGYDRAGVYVLVGSLSEETIYVGEADPVGARLKQHSATKEGWSWGVYFFDENRKIGKTEVQLLESELVALAKKFDRAVLLNKNHPTAPTMSPAAKATAQAFLSDMLMILPMLGITAFTAPKYEGPADEVVQLVNGTRDGDAGFDTVVVPAREEGFQARYINENCWFAIRINAKHLGKIKYIAAYRVLPIGAVTHIAEVASISPYGTTGKYLLKFKGPAQAIGPIPRTDESDVTMQAPRYAVRKRLLAAKNIDAIWKD